MLYITDTAGTSGSVIVPANGIVDALTPWYPEAPTEVYDAINSLQTDLVNGTHTGEWESYLAITVEDVPAGARVDLGDPARAEYIADTLQGEVSVYGGTVILCANALVDLAELAEDADGHFDGVHIWIGGTAYPVIRESWEIVASDRHGYGHQPQRYNGVVGTRDEAIADARNRYGKATGLDSEDITVTVL